MQLYVLGLYEPLIHLLIDGREAEAYEILAQLRAWEEDPLALGPDLGKLLL